MNRGSTPAYSWTNFDVRAVGGSLTVTIDDGNSGDPRFRDWCWNMDPENDEIVDIYYQRLGARVLRGVVLAVALIWPEIRRYGRLS